MPISQETLQPAISAAYCKVGVLNLNKNKLTINFTQTLIKNVYSWTSTNGLQMVNSDGDM